MQVIDGLLVVHNVDEKRSQCWDLKMGGGDYVEKILRGEGVEVKVQGEKYLMKSIEKKEKKIQDEAYKYFTGKLQKQFH